MAALETDIATMPSPSSFNYCTVPHPTPDIFIGTSRPLTPAPSTFTSFSTQFGFLVFYYIHSLASLIILQSFLPVLTSVWKNATVLPLSPHLSCGCCWSSQTLTDVLHVHGHQPQLGLALPSHPPIPSLLVISPNCNYLTPSHQLPRSSYQQSWTLASRGDRSLPNCNSLMSHLHLLTHLHTYPSSASSLLLQGSIFPLPFGRSIPPFFWVPCPFALSRVSS